MPKAKWSEVARHQHEQDVTCRSCLSVADPDDIYCPSCRDYWTNDAPALAEWDYEKDRTDENPTAA
jgi:hypothetical protein